MNASRATLVVLVALSAVATLVACARQGACVAGGSDSGDTTSWTYDYCVDGITESECSDGVPRGAHYEGETCTELGYRCNGSDTCQK